MNFFKMILGIQLIGLVESSFEARGNMRPAVTFASGLASKNYQTDDATEMSQTTKTTWTKIF